MTKKDKATKLPKKVGGVKLPKQLRKSAGVVAELAQNPMAREVVSAALVAGAAAIAKRKVNGAGASAGSRKSSTELDKLFTQGKDLGNILAQGVTAFFGALLNPPVRKADADAKPAAAKPAAARKLSAAKPAARKPVASKAAAPAKPAAARPAKAAKPRAKPGPKPGA
ncbi:MAG TPA: hypothetical protein VNT42_00860 [Sphingomonas sp.]|nr:hypothetical protein [Sphingomonas sp.]